MKKKMGFTLAEVLIVLAVLGIVAAVTLPTLNSNVTRRTVITKLAKVRSTLENAANMAMINNGVASATNLTSAQLLGEIKGSLSENTVTTRDGIGITYSSPNFTIDMDTGNNSTTDQYQLTLTASGDVNGTASTANELKTGTDDLLKQANRINK